MKPHKHVEVIKAWADGAVIQYWKAGWRDAIEPEWALDTDYRIKPARVFPTTSYTGAELEEIWGYAVGNQTGYIEIANAAIKRYIEDTEQASPL
jgi:hypothetical protein